MGEDQPESTTAWAASARSSALLRPRPSWKLWIVRVLAILGVLGFTVLGVIRVGEDRSFDLPWDGPSGHERLGFYRNGLPVRWTCPEGHDHWSLPYWMGGAAFAIPGAVAWLVYPRARRRG